jgi:hypothetical protein
VESVLAHLGVRGHRTAERLFWETQMFPGAHIWELLEHGDARITSGKRGGGMARRVGWGGVKTPREVNWAVGGGARTPQGVDPAIEGGI